MESITYLLGVLTVASGIGVVVHRNPLYSALLLVCNLLLVAALYASLEAHFLAVTQIAVYAGAIMVLVLFVLMLLNLKDEAVGRRSPALVVGTVATGLVLIGALAVIFCDSVQLMPEEQLIFNRKSSIGTVERIGELLYTQYVFLFEAASLVLMAALVGAVMLAKSQKKGAALRPR